MLDSGIVGSMNDDQQELLTMAVVNSDRLARLVNDILDLERLDSGRMPVNPESVDAVALAEQARIGMSGAAKAAGIEIVLEGPGNDTPVPMWADPHRILQVLTNLLGNAIKFSDRGSTIRITVAEAGDGVQIAVIDRGRGIPPDRLESVFERFGQVDAGDARREGGTGLGLAIARELVVRSGGTLEVSSIMGAGSTFTVTLPAADPAPAATESVPAPDESATVAVPLDVT